VAERAGVNASLIRYYERIGLLRVPERVSGQRRYDGSVLRRLAVIDVAQRAGLSLDEISGLLEIGSDPLSDRLQDMAQRKLPEIEALIDRAERVRAWLTTATGCGCVSVDDCTLFDNAALPDGAGRGLAVVAPRPTSRCATRTANTNASTTSGETATEPAGASCGCARSPKGKDRSSSAARRR
jgi:MerR family redox-sensitive transcriptional activator SoxR